MFMGGFANVLRVLSVLVAVVTTSGSSVAESPLQSSSRTTAADVPPPSVPELRKAVEALKASDPPDRAAIRRAYLALATACFRSKQYGECRDAAQQATDLLEDAPANYAESIRIREELEEGYAIIGRAQAHLGNFVSAQEHLRQALAIAQERWPCANSRIALRLHDLSILLACMGDVGNSLSPSGAASPSDLAFYLSVLGRDEAALAPHRRALEDALKAQAGGSALGAAASGLNLERLGAVYYALGAYEDSAKVRALALASVSDRLGIQSAASIACAQNLALTLITLDSSVTPDASALIRRIAVPARMSLPRSHPLAALIEQLAEACCVTLERCNEVDLYTMLFRLRDLPRNEPSPYGSIEKLCDDIRVAGTDPKASARLLNACVGWYGPSMRALGTYCALVGPHTESLTQAFRLPDSEGVALLGLPSVPATVTQLPTSGTGAPSLIRLHLADAYGATIAVWTVLPRWDGTGGGLLIWDESLWSSSPHAMETAVQMSSGFAPAVLTEQGQQVARQIVADEASQVRSNAYPTRQSAVGARDTRRQPQWARRPPHNGLEQLQV